MHFGQQNVSVVPRDHLLYVLLPLPGVSLTVMVKRIIHVVSVPESEFQVWTSLRSLVDEKLDSLCS